MHFNERIKVLFKFENYKNYKSHYPAYFPLLSVPLFFSSLFVPPLSTLPAKQSLKLRNGMNLIWTKTLQNQPITLTNKKDHNKILFFFCSLCGQDLLLPLEGGGLLFSRFRNCISICDWQESRHVTSTFLVESMCPINSTSALSHFRYLFFRCVFASFKLNANNAMQWV